VPINGNAGARGRRYPLCEDARMGMEPAHFTLIETGEFAPTTFAQSHWGDDHLNGPAVAGLAARARA